MMNGEFSKREWLDYINRLQERERQKIASGGITNWAIFVAIGGLGYWLFPFLPEIRNHFSYFVLGYMLFLNLSIAIFDIFNARFREKKILKYRYIHKSELGKDTTFLLKSFELLLWFFTVVPSAYLIVLNQKYIVVISFFLVFRHLRSLKSTLERVTNKVLMASNRSKRLLQNRYFMESLIFLVVSVYPFIHTFMSNSMNIEHLKIALYGLIVVLLVLLIQFLFVVFVKRIKIGWLEEFERTVVTNNMSSSSIQKKLNEEYFSVSRIDDYF